MSKIKVCIIGLSYGYRVLYNMLQYYKHVEVVGISSKSKKNYLLSKQKKIIYSTNWKELILITNPNIVIVATPPKVQNKILSFLIKKKIPFFAEKPMATNLMIAKKLYINQKKFSIPAVIDFNFISLPIFKYLKFILNHLNAEKILKYELDWYFSGKPKGRKFYSWKFDNNIGGGSINNYGSHVFSIIDFFFSRTISISSVFNYFNNNKYETIQINTQHIGKISGKISLKPQLSKKRKFKLKIICKNKNIEMINTSADYHSGFRLYEEINDKKKLLKSYYNRTKIDSRIFASKRIFMILLRLLKKQEQNIYSPYLGLKVQQLIEFSKKSNKLKRKIKIPKL